MTTLSFSKRSSWPVKAATLALAFALLAPLGATTADARMGGGSSFGSRGTRTFSAPPATATAPRPAFPMQRTETPNLGGPAASFAQPRRFGFGTGLAAGLLGAGVLGMLTGHGFFGGIGGLFSMLGFLLQIGLIVLLVRFAIGYFRNRNGGAAYAGAPGPAPRSPLGGLGANLGGLGAGLGGGSRPENREGVPIAQTDFAAFERTLSDIQYAYSREDFNALARLTTPEMLRHLGADIEANQRRGLRNDMSDIRLVQGDLAESWREGASDYATVAMRFSARDVMIDRTTGRIASGDPNRPVEVTEVWTFRRDRGNPWVLSGVQQTG